MLDLLRLTRNSLFLVGDKVRVFKRSLFNSLGHKVDFDPREEDEEIVLSVRPLVREAIFPLTCEGRYSLLSDQGRFSAYEKDMKPVAQGPLGKFIDGGFLRFSSYTEGKRQLILIGKHEFVVNLENTTYPFLWRSRDALDAIVVKRIGDVVITRDGGLDVEPGKETFVSLVKFENKDLGKLFMEVTMIRHGLI